MEAPYTAEKKYHLNVSEPKQELLLKALTSGFYQLLYMKKEEKKALTARLLQGK